MNKNHTIIIPQDNDKVNKLNEKLEEVNRILLLLKSTNGTFDEIAKYETSKSEILNEILKIKEKDFGLEEIKYKLFPTEKDYRDEIKSKIPNYAKTKYPDEFISKKFTEEQVLELVLKIVSIKYITSATEDNGFEIVNFYIRDFKTGIYHRLITSQNSLSILLRKSIFAVIDALNIKIKVKQQFTKNLIFELEHCDFHSLGIEELNMAPFNLQYHTNGIFDTSTKVLHKTDSKEFNEFHKKYAFLYRFPFDIKFQNELSNEQVKYLNYWKDFIKSICFIPDERSYTYFLQDLYSTYTGDGKGKYKIQIGSGANGKSTWDNVHKAIAGPSNTVICKLNELKDDNKVNRMKIGTKFTYGDDLDENIHLSGLDTERLKTLVTGGSLSVNRKYESDIIIQNKGNFHQNVNDYPKNIVDNPAMRRRFIVVKFTETNFALSKDLKVIGRGKAINSYIGEGKDGKINYDAITALMSLVIEIEDFDNYTLPTGSEKALDELLTESDNVLLAFNQLKVDHVFRLPYLPNNVLCDVINNLVSENNPSVKPASVRTITSKIKLKMEEMNYILLDKVIRISSIDREQFDLNIFKDEFNLKNDYKTPTRCWYNMANLINLDSINKDFINEKSYNECDFHEKFITELLLKTGDTKIIEYKNLN